MSVCFAGRIGSSEQSDGSHGAHSILERTIGLKGGEGRGRRRKNAEKGQASVLKKILITP